MGAPERSVEFVWEWIRHEDGLFLGRANFFMVAEGILLAGVAGLAAAEPNAFRTAAALLLCAAGFLMTVGWRQASRDQMCSVIGPLKRAFAEDNRYYAEVRGKRSDSDFGVHKILGVHLPAVFMAIWAVFAALLLAR